MSKTNQSEEVDSKRPQRQVYKGGGGEGFDPEFPFAPSGDQPKAIAQILNHFKSGIQHQVLLGVTGSGKTFTMANIIADLNVPTLILAPNKTLAAQLYAEFKELFPRNAVEYFVSYYDFYQPEAYIPSSDTYIEKDSAINEQIDRMRHSATYSLLERRDVIIVASVSCIYGLGSPEAYEGMVVQVSLNDLLKRDDFLRQLVHILYDRNDVDFHRGTFRVRGDVVEIFPPYEEDRVMRVEFFGDYVDRLSWVDPIRAQVISDVNVLAIYPGRHFVSTEENTKRAIQSIQEELLQCLIEMKSQMRLLEAQRLEQRTYYDIEMIEQLGYCQGIENYSRHLTGRKAGEPPPTLLEYFPKNFLTIIDESHVTVPQIGGMYRGDRARKMNLVEHGFRLPSALDNRPLNFSEFEKLTNRTIFVSATPGAYELEKSEGLIVEQVIRPTGLLDPVVEVRPAKNQVDDLLGEIRRRVEKQQRVLVTTLTKRMAEDLTEYYESVGVRVKYLHSDIKTVERSEILRDLRLGVFDVLIGINLLREGLDLPEVSLVAITDADKEGFLRSERSLIQTIGRAARHMEGFVILYADAMTQSMEKAIEVTRQRREIQGRYNLENNITPVTVRKRIMQGLGELYEAGIGNIPLSSALVAEPTAAYFTDSKKINKEIQKLRKKMKKASDNLEFEEAARIRDEIKRLQVIDLGLHSGSVDDEFDSITDKG